ncbi:MAG: amino acid-binding protein [Deltaproteobacteria bacterium RBG_13_51_10]|nr:MAG: amino acid-binding protein [Deltaproteobacteria bacterium RBG_13_51_10]
MLDLKLTLSILPETLVICQMDKDARIPDWLLAGTFYSITKTAEELSVVCPQTNVPEGIKKDEGWRCLKVEGPLDFSTTGILASLTMPLAKEGISVFAVSTYNTDYLLVKEQHLGKAVQVLSQNGHQIQYLKNY